LKHIVLFGAGKSSVYLIEYLCSQLVANQWKLTVLDADMDAAAKKINNAPQAFAAATDITNAAERWQWISSADIVVSLLPPSLHYLVAVDCIELEKNLLTASYVDDAMKALQDKIASKNLLFLCEMGLDPGIDHMSAMAIIDQLRKHGRTRRAEPDESASGFSAEPVENEDIQQLTE